MVKKGGKLYAVFYIMFYLCFTADTMYKADVNYCKLNEMKSSTCSP